MSIELFHDGLGMNEVSYFQCMVLVALTHRPKTPIKNLTPFLPPKPMRVLLVLLFLFIF